ncbi:MAG: hypothetical protein KBS85_08260 [Lachnospiraceae bacterium]|nr:hypothetical protein [Candidatus Merdinaster equi]
MKDQDTMRARELVSQMDKKDKFKHFVYYHRIQLIIAGVLIVVGIYALVAFLNRIDCLMYIGIVNGTSTKEDVIVSEMEAMLECKDRQIVTVKNSLMTQEPERDPEAKGVFFSDFQLTMASGDLNVIFADEDGVKYLAENAYLYTIDEWLPDNLKEIWSDRITEFTAYNLGKYDVMSWSEFMKTIDVETNEPTEVPESSQEEYAVQQMAINIAGTKVHELFGLPENVCYLVVPNSTEDSELIQKFCDYLVELEK